MYLVMTYVNVDEYLDQLSAERDELSDEKNHILEKRKRGHSN